MHLEPHPPSIMRKQPAHPPRQPWQLDGTTSHADPAAYTSECVVLGVDTKDAKAPLGAQREPRLPCELVATFVLLAVPRVKPEHCKDRLALAVPAVGCCFHAIGAFSHTPVPPCTCCPTVVVLLLLQLHQFLLSMVARAASLLY